MTGAGGGPAAAALAEAGLEVVLLEAGPRVAASGFVPDEALSRARLGRIASSADGLQSFYAGACVGGSSFATQRRIFAGIRSIALLGFYASPEARGLVGYPMGADAPIATIADAMAIPQGDPAHDGAPRS